MNNNFKFLIGAIFTTLISFSASAEESPLLQLQQDWAKTNYELGGDPQLASFEKLIEQVGLATTKNPKDASLWVWSGIIKSTYAGARGGLGALKFAKSAKVDLEKAIELSPAVLDGSAYTSLGTLYLNVPSWPIAFGNKDKAERLLLKALAVNPNGIDANYFYAEYLRKLKKPEQARVHYRKALAAAPRAGRALADSGRRAEIKKAMESL